MTGDSEVNSEKESCRGPHDHNNWRAVACLESYVGRVLKEDGDDARIDPVTEFMYRLCSTGTVKSMVMNLVLCIYTPADDVRC